MPPRKRKRRTNMINEKEAKMIGDFLVTIGEELNDANADLRSNVLKEADDGDRTDYYYVEDATAQYKMSLEVGSEANGVGKKRESEVVMNANYKRVSGGAENSPFSVLYGVIAPAERNRDAILVQLRKSFEDVTFDDMAPIFHVNGTKYWVSANGGSDYYVVELDLPGSATRITSLEELQEHLAGMHSFLQAQLSTVYNRR